MEPWIKEAAERLRRRREGERDRLGRRPDAAKTLHFQAPLLWRTLAHKIEIAINAFNNEFTADPLCPNPLMYSRLDHSITISTVYCTEHSPTQKLIVTFYGDRALVISGLSSSDGSAPPAAGPPHELQFRVSNDGRVEIYNGDHAISPDEAVRQILEPLIDCMDLIAF
ncbi:MAG TPA: hypothetical protein VI756_21515 [Blastocatellia bacterium]